MDATFRAGLRAAFPIVVGYLPIAVAFGAAAASAGLDWMPAGAISAIVWSGAGQFALVSALAAGTGLAPAILLCSLLALRHLLYGPVLAERLPAGRVRLALAFFLTDEVFATALATSGPIAAPWLFGLGMAAYLAWLVGTLAGALLGRGLEALAPSLSEAMRYALPALFIAIAWLHVNRRTALPMLVAGVVALGVASQAGATAGIFAGAAAGCLAGWRRR